MGGGRDESTEDGPIGEYALRRRFVTREQLDECLEEQARLRDAGTPVPLGQLLHRRGYLTNARLAEVLSRNDPRRRVALKVLRESDADPQHIARLHREARIAAQLLHPNIVGIHEVGIAEGADGEATHFIAMDFIEGRTFDSLLVPTRTPLDELLRVLEDAARAVGFAHSRGVVHRDLKPANILVENGGRVVLTDFGLARAERIGSRLTHPDAIVGTPAYMAPEQVEGRRDLIDARTDVYALGVILYEILAGQAPFRADAPRLYRDILEEEPAPPRTPHGGLELVCGKAMAKERADRYPHAASFADDLARFRRGETVLARRPALGTRLRRRLRRHGAAAAVLAAVLILAGAWLLAGSLARGDRIRDHLERALACEREGRLHEARDHYRRALDLDEDHAAAKAGFVRVGETILARDAADLRARDDELRRARAREEAARLLDSVRPELERSLRVVYDARADYGDLVRRVEAVQGRIREALEKAPELAAGHHLLGFAWEIRGEEEKAEACWRKAIELDPRAGAPRYRLGRLLMARAYLATLGHSPEEAESKRSGAEAAASEAARQIEEAGQDPGFDDALHRRIAEALQAYVRREHDAVHSIVHDALERFSGRDGAEELIWIHALVTAGENHLKFLDEAIERRPKFPLALFSRGLARHNRGGIDAAIADYSEALRFHPRFAQAYDNRGVARQVRGEYEAAAADHGEAIRLRPLAPGPWSNRAAVRLARGDADGAIEDATEALRLAPDYAAAWHARGNARMARREFEEAAADFTAALRHAPILARAWNNRALARKELRRLDEALLDLDRALEIDPRYAEAHGNRGIVLKGLGRIEEALESYSEAIRIQPRLPSAWFNRGILRMQTGDRTGAVGDLRTCLEVAPASWPNREKAREYLSQLDE